MRKLMAGVAVGVALFGGFIFETWRDKDKAQSCAKASLAAIVAGLVFLLIFLGLLLEARARDLTGQFKDSPLKPWFEGLTSPSGYRCCSDADGLGLDDLQWGTDDNGHYWVEIEGERVKIPEDSVIKEPNKVGRAMVWVYHRDGHPIARCFLPGSLG